jgi:ribosomal-protein-alanine N-acetyltransferase
MGLTHIKSVLEIESACFNQNKWSESSIRNELSNETSCCLLAKNAITNDIRGHIFMYHVLDAGFVTRFAVLKEFRNQGVGSFLLKGLLHHATLRELRTIMLEVRISNAAAIAVYEKFGFVATGHREAFYSHPHEDAILMTCFLEKH